MLHSVSSSPSKSDHAHCHKANSPSLIQEVMHMVYTAGRSPYSKQVENHYRRLVKTMEPEQARQNRWNNLTSFERTM